MVIEIESLTVTDVDVIIERIDGLRREVKELKADIERRYGEDRVSRLAHDREVRDWRLTHEAEEDRIRESHGTRISIMERRWAVFLAIITIGALAATGGAGWVAVFK